MKLEVYRQLWGVPDAFPAAASRFKARGYTGLEAWIGSIRDARDARAVLDEHDLNVIVLVATAPGSTGVRAHLEDFERQLRAAAPLRPAMINAHGGVDAWTAAEQDEFFAAALDAARHAPAPVAFETHRGRPTFNPWSTDRLVRAFPDLRLTLDLSHWVVVSERLIDDQADVLERAAERAAHVHARVGYEQGPQVPDPRAPEFAGHVAAHERWWRLAWNAARARGDDRVTITPEYGPPPYLHTLPFTGAPVADLDAISEWMTARLRDGFRAWSDDRAAGPRGEPA